MKTIKRFWKIKLKQWDKIPEGTEIPFKWDICDFKEYKNNKEWLEVAPSKISFYWWMITNSLFSKLSVLKITFHAKSGTRNRKHE